MSRAPPDIQAALKYAVSLSADVEVQLSQTTGGNPLLKLLAMARDAAAEAIVGLAVADPEDPKVIRSLQNEVACFNQIVEWLRKIVTDGYEAEHLLSKDEITDLAEAFGLDPEDAEEMLESGLAPHQTSEDR